ncbi:HORMA domain containing 2 [Cichlidogyrus casuarinus]|uniref:HORMA domain containing 2 n=1 Tax=Cichlidogyrus casuarinus TaxID=1844966 RepID=A0ABD2Q4V0_9PLAT
MAVAISNLLYQRKIIPSDSFTQKFWDGIEFMLLDEKCHHAPTLKVIAWLRSSFIAIEKQHAKQICFVLYPKGKDIDDAVEVYVFNFGYNGDEVQMNFSQESLDSFDVNNTQCWKQDIVLVLNAIKATETYLQPLPEDLMYTMKINFANELPEDFILPGFVDCDEERTIKFEKEKSNIRLGARVKTQFHAIKVVMQTEKGLCDEAAYNESRAEPEPSAEQDAGNCSLEESDSDNESRINCPCGSEVADFLMVNFFKHSIVKQNRICSDCADVMHLLILIRFS